MDKKVKKVGKYLSFHQYVLPTTKNLLTLLNFLAKLLNKREKYNNYRKELTLSYSFQVKMFRTYVKIAIKITRSIKITRNKITNTIAASCFP